MILSYACRENMEYYQKLATEVSRENLRRRYVSLAATWEQLAELTEAEEQLQRRSVASTPRQQQDNLSGLAFWCAALPPAA